MSLQIPEKTKAQGVDPAFVIMFSAVIVAVVASMTLRLTVGGAGPSKARGNDVGAVEHQDGEANSQKPVARRF